MKPTAAHHVMPAAAITHSTISMRGPVAPDVSAYHARTRDARIAVTFAGTMMVFYNCAAIQGLLEAFAAAKGHAAHIPSQIPGQASDPTRSPVRSALSIEWTRRADYAVMPQSAPNKLNSGTVRWLEIYTGPLTWQLRDRAALTSMIEVLIRVHKTGIAVFVDGDQHAADPTSDSFRVA